MVAAIEMHWNILVEYLLFIAIESRKRSHILGNLLLIGPDDQGYHNHQNDSDDETGQNKCHFEVLPPHLVLQFTGTLFEDSSLLIELVTLFSKALGFLSVLKHTCNVVLHLTLDNIDLTKHLLCLVHVAGILVALAVGREQSLGFLAQRVGRGHFCIGSELAIELGVEVLQHFDCNSGWVPSPCDDRNAYYWNRIENMREGRSKSLFKIILNKEFIPQVFENSALSFHNDAR